MEVCAIDRLKTLKQIFEGGFISTQEYEIRKKNLIDSLTSVEGQNSSTNEDIGRKKRRVSNEDVQTYLQTSSTATTCIVCLKSDQNEKIQCESCLSNQRNFLFVFVFVSFFFFFQFR
jgi:hypothetical protein